MTMLYVKKAKPQVPRRLTISQDPHWPSGLRAVGKGVATGSYQGEVLNFQTPAQLREHLTDARLKLLRLAQGQEVIPVRELHRRARCDEERVHEDVAVLIKLTLLEVAAAGEVVCPFESVEVDATAAALIAVRTNPSTNSGVIESFPTPSPLETTP
jgi:predicted transcriptional regulator